MVTIIDDDAGIRRSIGRLMETLNIESQSFDSARVALASTTQINISAPGCLLLDLRLPDMDGLDLLAKLRDAGVTKPVVIISAYGDVPTAVRAMKADAVDFIEKPFSEQSLLASIHKAIDKDACAIDSLQRKQVLQDKLDNLSEREKQVLQGILDGKSSKLIALDLNLSTKTIDNYRASVMEKMQAQNVAQLVRMIAIDFDS